ncbi:MAG: glycosyltransferase family A protein [Bacteroidales bacterium]|nr:glycosyltransferase family A protein [Bacteroidales bacterium]MDD4217556.1 glycosyltransferase family A protein [Bacteroidales bacterium]MDY0140760.1 glycosyltransferase family A protein [Bacteroidales bacterium]
MNFASFYFDRFNSKPKIFNNNPCSNTGIVVVIPCYRDEFVFKTLDSLEKAKNVSLGIEVIVILNSSENDLDKTIQMNKKISDELSSRADSLYYSNFNLLVHNEVNIPPKSAGVGNARKIGMDEAVRRFEFLNKPDGIVLSLDADTIVEPDYFVQIKNAFIKNKKTGAFYFQFQHDFDNLLYDQNVINACKLYETNLRYFRLALNYTEYPHAIHTIGSCFGVKAINYIKAGGMSRRQGGEDFYLLHKLSSQTKIGVVRKIIVRPSPRESDRVPFGTGPAVGQILNSNDYKVYQFKLFSILKEFFELFEDFYSDFTGSINKIPLQVLNYFGEDKIAAIVSECLKNTNNYKAFNKRMFSKFDAFATVKFLNSFDEDSEYAKIDVKLAAIELLNKLTPYNHQDSSVEQVYQSILELDCNS